MKDLMYSGKTRQESDLLGMKEIPAEALYGVQSLRGFENFHISGVTMRQYPNFIKGMALTKKGAAMANHQQGLLTDEQLRAISQACDELYEGKHHEYLISDMIQGGAGTTVNMNANEVIANRALQIMGKELGAYEFCSPNDHVNASQSTNDAYPTAFHFGLYLESEKLNEAFDLFIQSLEKKAGELDSVIKMGRTQLQDAVPMTLGQTFRGFANLLKAEKKKLEAVQHDLLCVNMGATAIGTGICSQPGYSKLCIEALREITGWDVTLADDLVAATSDTSVLVGYSSAIRAIALKVIKICNDLRLMGSGPRCGLHEIFLPEMQPGSSIMPGKVNPVIPEVMNQVCYKVIGNDTTIMLASENAQLELNVMEPVMVYSLFESINLMTNGLNTLRTLCIDGIRPDVENCERQVKYSIGIVTALNPIIGYKNSTKIAKEAMQTGKGVYDLVLEHDILSKEDLDTILAPKNMIEPVKLDIKAKH
ncbi:aspartate ammonia-lyase [Parabacteroides sp. PFB2-12]|uniref:aspartate ammonia-lyase n=1 Tax=unclassified Parabacteroides TaxID=2649774 RepID=UPI002474B744|nr:MULTISPECIES: aspartate ammonia-lyase [unclassified Parabacteroides]MDH6341737.1 aspartate ammonia-lyase [Parabacteroides sp. PM6-13]MDH6389840.1 aspartate ammonia-lyase [Parabacteroides sp. PFB2-12]